MSEPTTWEPKILAFLCNWCSYAGADLAGTSRLKYPPQIRIIKLPCTGRIDTMFMMRAFRDGADGVLVSGCHPGDCHYTSGNYIARRRFLLFRELMQFVGLEPERLHFSWVSAAEGAKFVDVVKKVTDSVRAVGPFRGFKAAATAAGGRGAEGWTATGPAIDLRQSKPADVADARKDLESGAVKAVLGLQDGRREGRLRAVWVRDPARTADLRASEDGRPLLATFLLRRLRQDPEGVYGIVAGPLDRQAIELLVAEQQIERDRVKVYEVDGRVEDRREKQAWEVFPVPSADAPAKERWDFWTAEFSRCLRCHACREDCPLCSCTRCITDKTRPRWIDASSTPEGNWLWNVTRAFHLGGRCVECGNCEEACPVGIPLVALTHHLNRVAEREWGPRVTDDKVGRGPLVCFRPDDKAEFIM